MPAGAKPQRLVCEHALQACRLNVLVRRQEPLLRGRRVCMGRAHGSSRARMSK
jgi:hypothetical protein